MEIIRLEAERDLLKKELAFALETMLATAAGEVNSKLAARIAHETIVHNLALAGVVLEPVK